MTRLTQDIHFPVTRAVYKEAPKRNWFQKLWKFITYKRNYELREDYILWIPAKSLFLYIPAPFFYDNASVPKLLSSLFNPDGMLLLGALPHDFGYRYKHLIFINPFTGELYLEDYNKVELDHLFQYLCGYESKFEKASAVAGTGLSLFGFAGWNSNRKKDSRLYEDFPELFTEEDVC